ncbi:unnamed protein product [Ceutorhynchus assimilis]|uniref:Uncharacterized protein n=1 Tax=Ceutorhynchus assimilis TaxID=467358 RepID=A0A9N9MXT9_9CUCU|nr:unnamed protein product [Ceutorhynchus assimilis]
MAPSVKIVDSIDGSSGTSFEAALGMLEASTVLCKSKKKDGHSSNNLLSKSRQPIKKIDSANEDLKYRKIKEESSRSKKRESSLSKKKTPYKSEHDKENSDQPTGYRKEDKPERNIKIIIRSYSGEDNHHFEKKLGDINNENSKKRISKSHKKSVEKHTLSDYNNKNKSTKKTSLEKKDTRKRHRDPSVDPEAKKRKLDHTNTSKCKNDTSENYNPYSRGPSGKIDFDRLIESGTVSLSDAMDLLLDSVPEIADVSLNNQKRRLVQGPEALSRVNAAKHNQNTLYAEHESAPTKVPSLVNICNAFFQDNLSLIGYTGGVPYSVMKPILQKATTGELYRIEFNNQYLLNGQTDELWELHCRRDLPYRKKLCWESYRDMYIRYEMERLTNLGVLTGNTNKQG